MPTLDIDTPADVPVKLLIDSRAELSAAVLMVVRASRHVVRCAAGDLSTFELSDRGVIDRLRALLLADRGNEVRLLVDDLQWIETRAARLKLLQRDFSHALQIRVADREDAVNDDQMVLGDAQHALQLRATTTIRGEMWLHNASYAQPLLAGFDRRWDRAAHGVAVAPLGL